MVLETKLYRRINLKRILLVALNILWFNSIIICQKSDEITYVMEVDMEYFIVAPLKSDFNIEIDYDPSALLKKVYERCNMVCLNDLDKSEWPERALKHSNLIMIIETELKKKGEYYGNPGLAVTERDLNGNSIMSSWFPSKIKYWRNKTKCANSAIKEFENTYENRPFLFGYTNHRIIYPKSGPNYIDRDTVSVTKTDIKWDIIDKLLDDDEYSTLEGVYTSLDYSGAKYTLGIFKSDTIHKIIILDSNVKGWEEGDLKGTVLNSSKSNEYSASWVLANYSYASPTLTLKANDILKVEFDESWIKKTKMFKKIM